MMEATRPTKKNKIIISVLLGVIVGLSGLYYICFYYGQGPIYNFNSVVDTAGILDIFDKDRYWLLANKDSSPEFMIKHRTPNYNPAYFGKMNIKVLRKDKKVAGFVTYYMENSDNWHLLFMAVEQGFRGHGYGKQLIEYALDDMVKRGAKRIWLCTRLANLPAQRIYKEIGFTEYYYTQSGYVYFEYIP